MIPTKKVGLPDSAAVDHRKLWCCYLALIALGKELVLMHGLHECFDREDKGQPSAINLHATKIN